MLGEVEVVERNRGATVFCSGASVGSHRIGAEAPRTWPTARQRPPRVLPFSAGQRLL